MSTSYEHRRYEVLRRLVADRYGAVSTDEMMVIKRSVSIDILEVADSGKRPKVRSDFLRWLVTDPKASGQIDPQGIRLYNASVPSLLNLNFCKIPFALEFRFCTLDDGMCLQWTELPTLQLFNCQIETGIWADEARILGDLTINSCRASAKISLSGARISGNLDCSGTKLIVTGDAIDASAAEIGGTVFLASTSSSRDDRFESNGVIRLSGCQIGRNLSCSGAQLTPAGDALDVSAAKVSGDIYFDHGFSSTGTLQLVDAEIVGDLVCSGARLTSNGKALDAGSAKMRSLFLDEGFSSTGIITLRDTEIQGDLDCQGAKQFAAIQCDHMRVGQRMIYLDIVSPEGADLELFEASVGALHDDENSWPGDLKLDGFVYQGLVLHKRASADQIKQNEFGEILRLDPENRIRWLRLQPDSMLDNAQPWMQLAKLLESMGDTRGAKHVVYEFHRQRARNSGWRPVSFVYDQIQEQPLRVGWPIAFFWALGSLIFWRANRMEAMTRSGSESNIIWDDARSAPGSYTPFHPIVYALENVLPVVKLGEDSAWNPDPRANTTWLPCWPWLDRKVSSTRLRRAGRWIIRLDYKRLALLRWTLILVGWGLALILAAAIGEQFKH